MAINILFTSAGRRNYLINYFKDALNNEGKVVVTDMSFSAPSMVDADLAFLVPNFFDKNYISELKKIIIAQNITAVISLNDYELPIISKHKSELEETGTKVIISNERVIDMAFDKIKTFDFLNSIGIQTPKTFLELTDVKSAIKNDTLKFPLVIKPRWGSASTGIYYSNSIEELDLAFQLQQLKQKHLGKNEILIQEKINGREFGMDIINDFNGNYYGTFVREKLNMRSGETDKAISVIDKRFEVIGKKIAEHTKHIGSIDCDIFIANDKLYVLELNPRFGGGYPFSHEAGINTAAIYIEWLKGNKKVDQFNNYESGIQFSKCDRMVKINSLK